MEVDVWLSVFLFIVLLVFSAYFSGSESAFFSLSELDLQRLKDQEKKSHQARRILFLLKKPKRLLTCILIGNTIVNVAAATVAALSLSPVLHHIGIGQEGGILLEIIIVTLVILIFSEVSPKVFAVKQPIPFAALVSIPMIMIVKGLTPLAWIFENLSKGISHTLGIKKELAFATEEELKTLIEVGEDEGALDKSEREMIHSIFEFRETMVKEVMIPRIDMMCVDKNMPLDEVLTLVKEKGHSRIPVYDEKVDNIKGVLHVKDLLPFMGGINQLPNLLDLVRKALFVPESKLIDELLREFQKERTHMAIVVDEYGGTAGLVTLEDVIEEIVGEIRDEYDKEKPLIEQIDNNNWMVDAKIDIEDFNEALGFQIPAEEDYESLGGFIFSLLGRIPKEKEEVEYNGSRLIVEKVQRQRIVRVRIARDIDSKKDIKG